MDKIKNFFKSKNVQNYLISIAFMVFGILLIIFPQSAIKWVCLASGVLLIVCGAVKLINYFVTELKIVGGNSLAVSVALIAFGLLLIFRYEFITSIFALIFGIVLTVDAVLKLQRAVDMLKLKAKSGWIVFAVALITLAIGLVVIFNPFESAVTLAIFVGISLLVDGILDIASQIFYSVTVNGSGEDSQSGSNKRVLRAKVSTENEEQTQNETDNQNAAVNGDPVDDKIIDV
ncbi:MAG: DUF308 domain-containing protein [Clostridia bacterium]|nr:DUF308 domain-containing protein [Clostridia bacterium]